MLLGINALTPNVATWVTSTKHPVPDRVNLSFVIFFTSGHSDAQPFDLGLSVRVPGCQKLQMTA